MKLESTIHPDHYNVVALLAGLIIAAITWKVLDSRVQELQWQPVYGESAQGAEASTISDHYNSLPLVEAVGSFTGPESLMLNDMAIEAAFREPIFAPTEDQIAADASAVDKEVKGPTLAEQFLIKYRPLIGAITPRGVVVSGVFWKYGEKIRTMPMQVVSDEGDVPTGGFKDLPWTRTVYTKNKLLN